MNLGKNNFLSAQPFSLLGKRILAERKFLALFNPPNADK